MFRLEGIDRLRIVIAYIVDQEIEPALGPVDREERPFDATQQGNVNVNGARVTALLGDFIREALGFRLRGAVADYHCVSSCRQDFAQVPP
jgi:hypothetical protein